MTNRFLPIVVLFVTSLSFVSYQTKDDIPMRGGERDTNGNIIMINRENLPISSDTSFIDFISMEDMCSDMKSRSSFGNRSIDEDILSDSWRYYENALLIDGGYAMIGGQVYKTVVIGDQRWFLEDYKDAGLAKTSTNLWERTVFGAQPSVFTTDTALYFYYDATLRANGIASTMDFNAPSELHPTTAWKLPNRYDLTHLWCMLGYNNSKMSDLFYEDQHKGGIIAE